MDQTQAEEAVSAAQKAVEEAKAAVEAAQTAVLEAIDGGSSEEIAKAYKDLIAAKGDRYKGKITKTFKIVKAANTLKIQAKTAKINFKKLKKKAQTLKVSSVIKFTNKGQGTRTYAKASGNKKITISKKTGKVTVKKGLKKGTYKVKVKVTAKGNATHKKTTKAVTFKIQIK